MKKARPGGYEGRKDFTMNVSERIKMVKAMEFIARQINNENLITEIWFLGGVADGEIEYGDLTVKDTDADDLYVYIEDDEDLADLMEEFLEVMCLAHESGGLYCDDVVSKPSPV